MTESEREDVSLFREDLDSYRLRFESIITQKESELHNSREAIDVASS